MGRKHTELTAGTGLQYIYASVRDSLKRLQLDYIDVLQCQWGVLISVPWARKTECSRILLFL